MTYDWPTVEAFLELTHALGGKAVLTHEQQRAIPAEVVPYWSFYLATETTPASDRWVLELTKSEALVHRERDMVSFRTGFAKRKDLREYLKFARALLVSP